MLAAHILALLVIFVASLFSPQAAWLSILVLSLVSNRHSLCNRGATSASTVHHQQYFLRKSWPTLFNVYAFVSQLRPNSTFNRTHCGVPPFGPNSLAQMPSHHNGPVNFDVRPHISQTVAHHLRENKTVEALCSLRFTRCQGTPRQNHAVHAF